VVGNQIGCRAADNAPGQLVHKEEAEHGHANRGLNRDRPTGRADDQEYEIIPSVLRNRPWPDLYFGAEPGMSLASWVREGLCAQSGHPAERAGSAMARPFVDNRLVGESADPRRDASSTLPTGAHQRHSMTVWRSCLRFASTSSRAWWRSGVRVATSRASEAGLRRRNRKLLAIRTRARGRDRSRRVTSQ
jgi:hypothetical protein